ncbi:alpha-L-rhamnosidase C-terminal domain-containing protein [Colwelliaceae bacterium BS250]
MKIIINAILCLSLAFSASLSATTDAAASTWKAEWVTTYENQSATNTWLAFHKNIDIKEVPTQALAKIAVDSKYWLWINGELVVFEGQLKRGPTPEDTYYDEVDIASYLTEGSNDIAVLVWYFGKDGFSHKSSGAAGLIFESITPSFEILSDKSWKGQIHPAFDQTMKPHPNFRLPESNIRFDANRGNFAFTKKGFQPKAGWKEVRLLGKVPTAPWNQLVKRPIPLWKDFGLKDYEHGPKTPFVSDGEKIIVKLPYNAQVTPYFEVETHAGQLIKLTTDHYKGGGPFNVRGEYITKKGKQSYENLGWMNGHNVIYEIPKGVKVLSLKYRETGYNAEFTGSFTSNDAFFNKLWQKANRTLYVTMRDTYMDCPDRERSQWWGDMVVESGEAFYALSPESSDLTKKGILELINWQRDDHTIFSPVPAGNWDKELPGQMLSSIGYFGFWNYYMNTGDKETIAKVYDGVKRYLDVWELDENGLLVKRLTGDTGSGHSDKGWYWGDWGTNVDKDLLMNEWYYLALKGYKNMSELLGKEAQANWAESTMVNFKTAFNTTFWKGNEYRSYNYKDDIDDRGQALAVVAGLADSEKYKTIYKTLQTQEYASPYMEKYVVEALFLMGEAEFGLQRMKKRFKKMVEHPQITTLWEGWGIGNDGYGGGSTNHAWSGGGLTILSQYVAGIYPLEVAYKTFKVRPILAGLTDVSARVPSIKGEIGVDLKKSGNQLTINLTVPAGTQAVLQLPDYTVAEAKNYPLYDEGGSEQGLLLPAGEYEFVAVSQ